MAGFVFATPTVTFNNQTPADLNITNAINNKLILNYNVTDGDGDLINSSIVLHYKTNSTLSNVMHIINGTSYSGYFQTTSLQRTNLSANRYTWTLTDNEIYPSVTNIDTRKMDNYPHTKVILSSSNSYILTEFLKVNSSKQWGVFEIMANSTATANPVSAFYCNSSYISGDVSTNSNCALISTKTHTSAFDHCHLNQSCHLSFQFAVDTDLHRIGNVGITSTSYFVFGKSKDWNYYTVANSTRQNSQKTTTNKGVTWGAVSITADAHLHQYDNNENQTFSSYACANDTMTPNTAVCSDVHLDLMQMAGLPPSSPAVYNPAEGDIILDNLTINYTASVSPNAYSISYYNISLLNPDYSLNQSIRENNSLNLSYIWTPPSSLMSNRYIVRVIATDVLGQSSIGYSDNFTIGEYIGVTSPRNGWIYRSSIVNLNVTTPISNPTACSYRLFGQDNFTFPCNSTSTPAFNFEVPINHGNVTMDIFQDNGTLYTVSRTFSIDNDFSTKGFLLVGLLLIFIILPVLFLYYGFKIGEGNIAFKMFMTLLGMSCIYLFIHFGRILSEEFIHITSITDLFDIMAEIYSYILLAILSYWMLSILYTVLMNFIKHRKISLGGN